LIQKTANGICVGRQKVARLMRLARLRGSPRRLFRVTTQRDPRHTVASNLLKQNFSSDAPNQAWEADITYIPTHQGWLYLAVVMDLYSRRVVGWSMSRRIVLAALRVTIDDGDPREHSSTTRTVAAYIPAMTSGTSSPATALMLRTSSGSFPERLLKMSAIY